ncbi:MAG: zinc-dependent dehydrogenase [Syntrophales bacterium]|nr:zinc-dependent dehydrogenase [Syntrophales bacterium]
MKVAVYYNNNDIRIEERPTPNIGPNEILVKVMASGICGSDVMEWYRIKKAPLVLGHEISGIIAAVGDQVKKYFVGQRVFVSHHIPCNTCYYCLRGHHTACETLHTTNYDPGGFAEFIRIPPLNVDRGVFPLPEEITFEEGVFIEPLACAIRGQRNATLKPGQSVLVLGCGVAGILHILLAKALGAGKILATDVHPFRRSFAAHMGAHAVTDAYTDLPFWVRENNDGRLADVVIVCAGVLNAFEQAIKCVDRGGTVLCFATTPPDQCLSLPLSELWRQEIKLLSSYGNAPLDAIEAIEMIRYGRVRVKELITHCLPLKEIARGFQLVSQGGESMKVIILPHAG